MYLTLFAARTQGTCDGDTARALAANRLGLPPTPALAWANANKALRTQESDDTLSWRIVYAVMWLQAARGQRYPGWTQRINHLAKLEKATSAAAAWLEELAAPDAHTPLPTLQTALKRFHQAGLQSDRARARLLVAWQKLSQDAQTLPARKAG